MDDYNSGARTSKGIKNVVVLIIEYCVEHCSTK